MSRPGHRLICHTCGRNVGANNAGKVGRHLPPGSRQFDRACGGSGKVGEPAGKAHFTRPEDMDPIIAVLYSRRETIGLLQRDVAALAGCSVQQYGHIERGVSSPQLMTLRGILTALKLDLTLHSAGTSTVTETERAGIILRLEAEAAHLRAQLGSSAGWQAYARVHKEFVEIRDRADRFAAQVEQQHARAVAAEETVSEVRTENRKLRTEITRLTELRKRTQDEARQISVMQAELDAARSETRRALAALDALARQPVLTHDLIDKARSVIAARVA